MASNGTASAPVVQADEPIIPPPEVAPHEEYFPFDIPLRLEDDCLTNYFRARSGDRASVRGRFPNGEATVTRELKRIDDLRKTFEKENEPDMEVFKYRQAEWKQHAWGSSGPNLQSIDGRVAEMTRLTDDDKKKRKKIERSILAAVGKWEKPSVPLQPASLRETPEEVEKVHSKYPMFSKMREKLCRQHKSEVHPQRSRHVAEAADNSSQKEDKPIIPDDSYGIAIHQITLKKDDVNCPGSYMFHNSVRHHLKDILEPGEHSPLNKEKHIPKTIRYFHIPANNMHWVEVCKVVLLSSIVY